MEIKFILEIRIFCKRSLVLMGHHACVKNEIKSSSIIYFIPKSLHVVLISSNKHFYLCFYDQFVNQAHCFVRTLFNFCQSNILQNIAPSFEPSYSPPSSYLLTVFTWPSDFKNKMKSTNNIQLTFNQILIPRSR